MQTFTVTGNLGRDAEVSKTQSGKDLVKFSIASKGYKETTWFNCVSFQERHVKLAQYLTKGSVVSVSGELELRRVGDGAGHWVSVVVNNIGLHGGNKMQETAQPKMEAQSSGMDSLDDLSDEIPFSFWLMFILPSFLLMGV